MESLLRLSGLLSDEDAGATDLGTLEKRLADKTAAMQREGSTPNRNSGTPGPFKDGSSDGTPRQMEGSPASQSASPEPPNLRKKEEEVEALSDMMCSLVTNNSGETRYIGWYSRISILHSTLNFVRLLIWFFDIFSKRYTMGE
jgi:hypothetical protein